MRIFKSAQYTECRKYIQRIDTGFIYRIKCKRSEGTATALSDFSQGNYGGALDVLLKQAGDISGALYVHRNMLRSY